MTVVGVTRSAQPRILVDAEGALGGAGPVSLDRVKGVQQVDAAEPGHRVDLEDVVGIGDSRAAAPRALDLRRTECVLGPETPGAGDRKGLVLLRAARSTSATALSSSAALTISATIRSPISGARPEKCMSPSKMLGAGPPPASSTVKLAGW